VRREPLHPGAQHSLFPSEMFRFWGHYTDAEGDPVILDVHMRAHAHVEDNIKTVEGLRRATVSLSPTSTQPRLARVVTFADSLVRWFQQLCLTGALASAEPKTLRWALWHTPARLVRNARRRVVRILEDWPTTTTLLDAHGRIAQLI